MNDGSRISLRAGMRFPEFIEGRDSPSSQSAGDMNLLRRAIQALCNFKVIRGSADNFLLSDENAILQLGMGGYDGGSGGGVAMWRLKSVQNDYVTCRSWDGSSDGPTDTYLAKEWKIRTSLTGETIFGVSHTYTYGTGPDSLNKYRNNSDGTNSEQEIIIPPWSVNEIVFSVSGKTDVVDGSSNPVNLLLVGRTAEWGKTSPVAVTPTTPASSTDTTNGYTGGLIVADGNYIYVSVGTNTWKRVAISTW